jgi:hypothetical protein
MLPWAAPSHRGGIAIGRRRAPSLGDVIEELNGPAQAREVEQVQGVRPGRVVGYGGVVGAAQGDGGVAPVREPDDEIGVSSSAQANDLDALTAEGVMRMGDGDESRRRWG